VPTDLHAIKYGQRGLDIETVFTMKVPLVHRITLTSLAPSGRSSAFCLFQPYKNAALAAAHHSLHTHPFPPTSNTSNNVQPRCLLRHDHRRRPRGPHRDDGEPPPQFPHRVIPNETELGSVPRDGEWQVAWDGELGGSCGTDRGVRRRGTRDLLLSPAAASFGSHKRVV